jgi:hypothetical protein
MRWTSSGQAGGLSGGFYDKRADGDIRHKMAIHDVDMNPVGAGRLNGLNFFAETREIGGQNGWGDQFHRVSFLSTGFPDGVSAPQKIRPFRGDAELVCSHPWGSIRGDKDGGKSGGRSSIANWGHSLKNKVMTSLGLFGFGAADGIHQDTAGLEPGRQS